MALTRKMLKAMGIEEDKIDQIIDAHTETVDALKSERDKYKEDAEKLPKVQEELEKAKDAAKNSGEAAKIQKAFDDYKAEVESRETLAAKKAALTKLAKDANLSEAGISKALKYAEFDKLELDEKGEIKEAKTVLKGVKDEWADYVQTENKKGADTATPPDGGGKSYKSKAEIMAIKDTGERQKAIADNMNLFRGG